jgi:hypothetical protein
MHQQKPKGNKTKLTFTFEGAVTFIREIRIGVKRGSDSETS